MALTATRLQRLFGLSMVFLATLLPVHSVYAQDMMAGRNCPMCGMTGWDGMVLGALFMIAVVGALVSLAIFLVKRSRTPGRRDHRT